VNYLFLANIGIEDHPELMVEPFNASNEMNDYEVPSSICGRFLGANDLLFRLSLDSMGTPRLDSRREGGLLFLERDHSASRCFSRVASEDDNLTGYQEEIAADSEVAYNFHSRNGKFC
jgi:hypothetical protein